MQKINFKILVIILLTALVGGFLITPKDANAASTTPTLFIHGYGGTHNSTDYMIGAAERDAGAKKALTINVQRNGQLKIKGTLTNKTVKPLIQINFTNNKATNKKQAAWLISILETLKSKYHVQQFNVVAHSAGNPALYQAVSNTKYQSEIPTLKKYVDLAGPFNGIVGMNDTPNKIKLNKDYKPDHYSAQRGAYPGFKTFLTIGKTFPEHVKILNIYGNLDDGTNSDKRVTVQSALSINYLLRNRHDSIKNVEMHGLEHSQLHHSNKVNQKMFKFLWS